MSSSEKKSKCNNSIALFVLTFVQQGEQGLSDLLPQKVEKMLSGEAVYGVSSDRLMWKHPCFRLRETF